MLRRFRTRRAALAALAATLALGSTALLGGALPVAATPTATGAATATTPIKHLVVIFQENVSFDHYFATYPGVNGLSETLLTHNPNSEQPQLLTREQALTCDQGHGYTEEQQAADHGLMDKFVEFTNREGCADPAFKEPGLVMDYYDGSTVTALWNYAHRFAMSDNSYDTVFGPSTPGALNLISGQTHGVIADNGDEHPVPASHVIDGTVIGDPQPLLDSCSYRDAVQMDGRNVGDLLNDNDVTWGWFQGGFADCDAAHEIGADTVGQQTGSMFKDYIQHHQPFQYYESTANPDHTPPASVAEIGHDGAANHQYDLTDFWAAADAGSLPAVSFLKAPGYQDGHPGYSDPLDEQVFLVETLNRLQHMKEWKDTAVVIAYDDSDGWYDHQMPPIVNNSQTAADALTGDGECGTAAPLGGYQGRCGYGPRQPLLVLSPYARHDFVDHTVTDQTSILRFIEDNWDLGRIGDGSFDALAGPLTNMFDFSHPNNSKLILDPHTGQPNGQGHSG